MTVFLIVAALLTAGALLFILPTLLRKEAVVHRHALRDEVNLTVLRDQLRELDADLVAGIIDAPGYEKAKQELHRRVAEDVQPGVASAAATSDKRWTAVVAALAIPVAAASLYLLLGSPTGLDPLQVAAPKNEAHEVTEDQIAGMIGVLEQRLNDKPDDVEGWAMLARSNYAVGRFAESAAAYARLVQLVPDDAALLSDYADTLGMSQNKSLQGEPEKLIARALVADPKNIKALHLSGSAAFERRDYQGAVTQWKKLLLLVPPESDNARSIMGSIDEAQGLLTGAPATAQAPVAAAATASTAMASTAAAATVAGTVELDPALRSKVADTDAVFIFARAAEGSHSLLAVMRKQVKDLPASFVLDDSMSMVPDAKLSNFPLVVVSARISKSGSATPSPGDFEGMTEPVRPGTKGLKIRINTQRK